MISYYSIAPDKDYAYWFDTIHNNGVGFSSSADNEVVISNKGGVGVDTKTVAALTAANTYNWVADDTGQPESQFSTTVISPGINPGSDGRTHPFTGFTGARGYRDLRERGLPRSVSRRPARYDPAMSCAWSTNIRPRRSGSKT